MQIFKISFVIILYLLFFNISKAESVKLTSSAEELLKYIIYIIIFLIGIIYLILRYLRARYIKELLQNLCNLFETSSTAIYIEQDGKLVYVNPSGISLLGYNSTEDIVGKDIGCIFLDNETDRIKKVINSIYIDRQKSIKVESKVITKDAIPRDVEVSITKFIYNGKPAIQLLISDITQRKEVEASKKRLMKMFFSAVDNSPIPIIIHNEEGEIIHVNKNLLKITGYSKEKLKTIKDFVKMAFPDIETREKMLQEFESLYKIEETIERGDIKITTSEGKERIWSIQSVPIGIWNGKRTVMCVAEDLTEKIKLQEQFIQAQKMEAVGRLAGGIAHDFNNMLSAITGYAQLGLMKLKKDDPLRKNFEIIFTSAEKAAKLTQQLLVFSKKHILMPEVINLNNIIEDMEKMIRSFIGEEIELEFIKKKELWNVKADPTSIEQVIMNLVVNARDAMPDGGKLTIETDNVILDKTYAKYVDILPGEYVMLSIADTGYGMTEEVKAHIFEPFFTTKTQGTGLGLATVYGIVKQSKGHISVYSEQGKGTVFKVYLPKYNKEESKYIKQSYDTGKLFKGNETIMVVDDNDYVRNFIVSVLTEAGYTVIEAKNGKEALDISLKYHGKIHLLLTDVVLPGMNGKLLADKMSRISPELKIIYMSGYTEDAIVKYGIFIDKVNFLQKFFTPQELTKNIRMVLDS